MRQFQGGGAAVSVNMNDPDGIQSQEEEIHQIILGNGFSIQMRMNEPQSTQSCPAATALGEFFDVNGFGISHQNRHYFSIPADE